MANNKDFDFIKMFYDIRKLCLTEDHCVQCKGKACLVGYARHCIGSCNKLDEDSVPGGFENVPSYDINGGYDLQDALEAIAHTLQQCRSCKDNHTEDCLVNIVRTCYEVIAFGDHQEFSGSAFMYLTTLAQTHPKEAAIISEAYKNHDNPMEETL